MHRTAESPMLEDGFAVIYILPRPERRALSRVMIKAALVTALALALAACASAPPKLYNPPNPAPGEAGGSSDAPYGVHPLPDRRGRMVDTAASMLGQPYRFRGAAPR